MPEPHDEIEDGLEDETEVDTENAGVDEVETGHESFLDRLRGGGIGTEDPMIVGDAGPTDIPPGSDGDSPLVTTDEPVDHLEV